MHTIVLEAKVNGLKVWVRSSFYITYLVTFVVFGHVDLQQLWAGDGLGCSCFFPVNETTNTM